MSVRILAIGDLHLGRTPSRLPEALREQGIEAFELTPAEGWRRAVRYAITKAVDAVVFAGDLVESSNAGFEAYGVLRKGVSELTAAGIAVFAVAGNHDVNVLPRLAAQIPEFRLLGANGCWEYGEIEQRGQRVARVAGWSFPAPHHRRSPLEQRPDLPDDGLAWIGLLHCDLDASSSSYAPVYRRELEDLSASAWLLGHIHRPSLRSAGTPLGYLGSLVPLDPSEMGDHSAWLLTLGEAGQPVALEPVPLSPLRWETLRLDASALAEPKEELWGALIRGVEQRTLEFEDEAEGLRVLGLRVVLHGRSSALSALRGAARELESQHEVFPAGRLLAFVDKISVEAQAAIELEELARGRTPPALLAARLIALRAGEGDAQALVSAARSELEAELAKPVYAPLGEPPALSDEDLRSWLLKAGEFALDELLRQGPEP